MNAYPLTWPAAYPRTSNRQRARFETISFGLARDTLLHSLKLMGAREVILSSNVPLRGDGLPYADFERRRITDPGVAVYFKYKSGQRVLACDRWVSIEHNLRALFLTIEAMRGLDRWGASAVLERAFTGFTALPAPEQWWNALGFPTPPSLEGAEKAYRWLMKSCHPDVGGSDQKASKLNWAIERARQELT